MMAMLLPRTIVVRPGNANKFNLRAACGNPVDAPLVLCIAEGTITSDDVNTPAFTTGSGWSAAAQLVLINSGTITGAQGPAGSNGTGTSGNYGIYGSKGLGGSGYGDNAQAGQSGGNGSAGSATNGGNGGTGGVSFSAPNKIVVQNSGAIIGGPGGNGGSGGVGSGGAGGAGGGGGAGGQRISQTDGSNPVYYDGGNGGDGQINPNLPPSTGGTGSAGSRGGDGGYIGFSGSSGQTPTSYSPGLLVTAYPGKSGGPAGANGSTARGANGATGTRGYAVSGHSNVTFITPGTITGGTT